MWDSRLCKAHRPQMPTQNQTCRPKPHVLQALLQGRLHALRVDAVSLYHILGADLLWSQQLLPQGICNKQHGAHHAERPTGQTRVSSSARACNTIWLSRMLMHSKVTNEAVQTRHSGGIDCGVLGACKENAQHGLTRWDGLMTWTSCQPQSSRHSLHIQQPPLDGNYANMNDTLWRSMFCFASTTHHNLTLYNSVMICCKKKYCLCAIQNVIIGFSTPTKDDRSACLHQTLSTGAIFIIERTYKKTRPATNRTRVIAISRLVAWTRKLQIFTSCMKPAKITMMSRPASSKWSRAVRVKQGMLLGLRVSTMLLKMQGSKHELQLAWSWIWSSNLDALQKHVRETGEVGSVGGLQPHPLDSKPIVGGLESTSVVWFTGWQKSTGVGDRPLEKQHSNGNGVKIVHNTQEQ